MTIIGSILDVTAETAIAKNLALSERKLRMLSAELFAAQEKEMKRLSVELHDGIGQYLSERFAQRHRITRLRPPSLRSPRVRDSRGEGNRAGRKRLSWSGVPLAACAVSAVKYRLEAYVYSPDPRKQEDPKESLKGTLELLQDAIDEVRVLAVDFAARHSR